MKFFKRVFSRPDIAFIILLLNLVVWLICLPLFQDGMFIDGIQYAAVSRNLARSLGSFWFPVLAQNSVAGLNTFHEHPPLVFFIQSIFFKIFGLHNIYSERIYCLAAFSITALFLVMIWRKLYEEQPELRGLSWLPVIMWVIMPIVFWSYANDIQENTQAVFTTAAIYFLLSAMQSCFPLRSYTFYGGCISVLLAALCKGVPGLFPISFFLIYCIVFRKYSLRASVKYTLITILLLLAMGIIILQNQTAREALHIWFFDRMLNRIAGHPTVSNHFYILKGLLTEQLPSIILCAVLLMFFRTKKSGKFSDSRNFGFFILLGLSGSLPLMAILVQRNFYFTPALPWFAIAWAALSVKATAELVTTLNKQRKLRFAIISIFVTCLLVGVITTVIKAGQPKRDKELLEDVSALKKFIPEDGFISVTPEVMWNDWSFRCYMMRYNSISFSTEDTCAYFLERTNERPPESYQKINSSLHIYSLYRKSQ